MYFSDSDTSYVTARYLSTLEINFCVSSDVENWSEGPVWLLAKFLQYLLEYFLLLEERNPFRKNPQQISVFRAFGRLIGVCKGLVYATLVSISVKNNSVKLRTSRYFQP